MITSNALRQKYLDFFKSKNHAIIASAPLIPENDPTVLFTTAGMHPLVPYLMGETHPEGKRLANVQKCIRTQDIDEVGDNRHDTFFEMMGNWSLGDYFKQEAIEWSWEFLTSEMWLGLDKRKLAVSVFLGDENAPKDEQSAKIWENLGVPMHKIAFLSRVNNWWGPAGQTGPCGPDTEMFFWMGKSEFPPESSNPATDEDNWLEIWNDVFMQYNKNAEGKYVPLTQKNVDTGMGLERTLVVLNGFSDVFQIDTFWPIIQKIESISGREYIESPEITKSMRIIADHIRTATMIMGDDRGVAPSNVDQGYIVRRLIRRAVRHGRNLGLENNFCVELSKVVISIFADVYPEVNRNADFALTEMEKEENKFEKTLEDGLKYAKQIGFFEFDQVDNQGNILKHGDPRPEDLFKLYTTYGWPPELAIEELDRKIKEKEDLLIESGYMSERWWTNEKKEKLIKGFNDLMQKHQELSRQGAEQKFKGGLADHGEMSVKYHTATHLLHAALRQVLGNHVEQKGSNITAERMRFDFSYNDKMTSEQIKEVEDLVNSAIDKDYPVSFSEMTVEEAKVKGAIGLFGDKYGERVKVYTVGDPEQSALVNASSPTFSREICGGPHVEHTGTMGHFKIMKEESSSAGIRR